MFGDHVSFFLDIVPGRALSESIQHSIITLLSHRLCLLLLFLSTLTLSAAFLLFCACFICIGLRAERSGVWEISPWTAGSVGALTLNARKCGSSRFKQSTMWELSFLILEIMGALTSNDQKCGSSRFKCSKVWERSIQKLKSMGALASNVQKYWSSYLKRLEVWELSHRSATKYSPTWRSRKCSKSSSRGWILPMFLMMDVFVKFRSGKVQKCGSFRFWAFKIWELLFQASESMGAVAWNYPKCGSSRFKRSKVWELSLYTSTSVGAPALSVQNCGSSRLKQPNVWEL